MGHPRNLRPATLIDQFERAAIRYLEARGISYQEDEEENAKIERHQANTKRQYLKTYNQLLRRLEENGSSA
jgi:hypothetical protein